MPNRYFSRKGYARLAASGVAMVAGLVLLAGCAKFTEPYKDAPRSGQDNGSPADIVRMPDGFSNVATKCDHGNRVYVVFHGDNKYGSIAVASNDPTCGSSK